MTQAQKKLALSQPSAKSAHKAAKHAFPTSETARHSAQTVVSFGQTAMKEFMATSAGEAQKAQEKAFAMGRESAENFAKSADAFGRVLNGVIGMSRDNVETCVECGDLTAELAKELSSELFANANQAFSDTVETSKAFFACRTLNDMVELQNRLVHQSLDNFFNESMKISNMLFEYGQQALDPINERVATATEQLGKVLE